MKSNSKERTIVDVHLAPVIHVEHIITSNSTSSSSNNNDRIFSCSSAVPPIRSTRDLSINNISDHTAATNSNHRPSSRTSSSSREKKYDAVRVTAIFEKDVAQQSCQERLATYSNKLGKSDATSRDPESDEIVQLLASQVYHLPGNSWSQDWIQYMANNHPVFGICFHSKLHPVGSCTRVVALIGTVIFGLTLTNFFYLFYLWNPQFNRVLATVATNNGDRFVLSTGMLLLWTLGGGIHNAFNLAMWHVAACACCRSGGCCESYACCPSLGKHMIRVFVLCIIVLCAMIVLLRVAIHEHQQDHDVGTSTAHNGINIYIDDGLDLDVHSASEFSFLVGYLVEMALAFFIYYPIGGTMLFSGMFACGFNIPLLGGRPFEVAAEERRKAKRKGGGSNTFSSVSKSRSGDDAELMC